MENPASQAIVSGDLDRTPELAVSADDFCSGLEDVTTVVRHKLLESMIHFNFREGDFGKIDEVIESPQMRAHLEMAIANGNYPNCLTDPETRSYIFELATTCIMGGLVDNVYRVDRRGVPRIYVERMVEMNNALAELAESSFGDQMSFGRSHLKRLFGLALRLPETDERVVGLEKGIAVEVGTKKYIDEAGKPLGIVACWSTAREDMDKIDLVCQKGDKKLYIQVKSSDPLASKTGSNPAAGYTRFEEYSLDEFRVRDLYPAAAGAIGENFEVKARGYRDKIEQLLDEFIRRSKN